MAIGTYVGNSQNTADFMRVFWTKSRLGTICWVFAFPSIFLNQPKEPALKKSDFSKPAVLLTEHTWSFSEALDWMVGAGETGQGGGAGGRNPGLGGMPPGSPPHLLGVCWAARFCFIEPQGVSLIGIALAFFVGFSSNWFHNCVIKADHIRTFWGS